MYSEFWVILYMFWLKYPHYLLFVGYDIGCVSPTRYNHTLQQYKEVEEAIDKLKSTVKYMQQWNKLLQLPMSSNPKPYR